MCAGCPSFLQSLKFPPAPLTGCLSPRITILKHTPPKQVTSGGHRQPILPSPVMHWLWLSYCFHSGLPLFHPHCGSYSRFLRPHLCRPEGLQRQNGLPWTVSGQGKRRLELALCRVQLCEPHKAAVVPSPAGLVCKSCPATASTTTGPGSGASLHNRNSFPLWVWFYLIMKLVHDNCKKIIQKEGRYWAGRFYPEIIILNVLLYSFSNFSMKQCIAKYIFPFSQKRESYYADGLCNLLLSLHNILQISLHVKNSDLHHHF